MPLRKTTKDFIEKAISIHGLKYDYSKVEYKNNRTKVCIICPEHGEFWQVPSYHISSGSECPKCAEINRANSKRKTFDKFLLEARMIHGYKYDYSKVEYIRNDKSVCIICPKHGEFWQTPDKHISQKQGCPMCGGTKRLTDSEFIERARNIHGGKYDYSKVIYKNMREPVSIICPEHGEFLQTPLSHLHGRNGCPRCSRQYMDTDFFKEISDKIHMGRYDYSKVIYNGGLNKVCIICPEHGEFWQIASEHLRGKGCPLCKTSKLETAVINYLSNKGIKYECQKKFDWLKCKQYLPIDIYIPSLNIGIECQGHHHFHPVYYSKSNTAIYDRNFEIRKEHDRIKKELCEEHNVHLEYVNYFDDCIFVLNKIFEKYGATDKT